jgi:molecular chaperone GrpE
MMNTMPNGAKKVKVNVIKDEPVPEIIDLEQAIDRIDQTAEKSRATAKPEPDWKEKYLRLAAEIENTKKRLAQNYARKAESDIERVLTEFLDVADNLELALAHANENDRSALVEGVRSIQRQVRQTLANQGVRPFEAEGKSFDPERHEAVSVLRRDDFPANTVVKVVRTGYYHGDRILRPARVVVTVEQ